jgi:hypothetical protein
MLASASGGAEGAGDGVMGGGKITGEHRPVGVLTLGASEIRKLDGSEILA